MQQRSALGIPEVAGYQQLHKIGEGGMGEVFLARQDKSERLVAIKFLAPSETNPEQERRFEREARLVAQLTHPNLVSVFEHGTASGRAYFVMEYVEGSSLRRLLEPGQPMDLKPARAILDGILAALTYLDEMKVVHRDLKPENVLVDNTGHIKVTDFGLSVAVTEVGLVTSTGEFLGTVDYMAPEQRARLPVDERADQYSLGVLAYELLTGKRPFGRFKPASQLNPKLSPSVDEVLAKALQEDPDDRYRTIEELHETLNRALAQRSRRSRRRIVVALAVLALLTFTALGLMIAARNRSMSPDPASAEKDPSAQIGGDSTKPHPEAEAAAASERKDQVSDSGPTAAKRAAEVEYFVKLAAEHGAGHRRELALTCYTEAIRLAPKDAGLRVQRAHSYLLNGMTQKALEDLDKALEMEPNLAAAHTERGAVYVQLEDYSRALVELNEAIRLNPNDSLAFAHRGRTYRGLKKPELALPDLDRAIKLDSDCGLAYHHRALLARSRKDYQQAVADFRQSLRCTPDNPFTYMALASHFATCPEMKLRDGKLAVDHARQACELTNWKDCQALGVLASAYAQDGDLAAAVQWAEKGLDLAQSAKDKRALGQQLAAYRKRASASGGGSRP
jgi:tetratricopeptide (TPR) repeat protein